MTALCATHALAQGSPYGSNNLHPWQVPPPRLSAEAYFTNLKDGDRIETPYVLKFGLSGGWGLAPIAQAGHGKSGHHHLLVNRDLPLNFKQALPFNDQYIHFGKGQMETVLTLAPGEYKLRMLLADQQHLPHFVYSKPTRIVVTRKNDTDPKTLQKKGLEIELDKTSARPPLRVGFHASLLNVAQMAQRIPESGHFRVTITPESGAAPAVMDFVDGETEVWLSPPAGRYGVKLEMLDNLAPERPLAEAVSARFEVR
ncbi:DUF4399 domain-containing protein [Hydrogenophaga sp.]|uniref:DUF4399 domain-containing protein n=1 Tax=Hydrogenophaga sp. TaxID=1904254 RepID=UPI0025BD3669|nr:DUF4399 domain-containing protein [Hydrogenophaga sp.]